MPGRDPLGGHGPRDAGPAGPRLPPAVPRGVEGRATSPDDGRVPGQSGPEHGAGQPGSDLPPHAQCIHTLAPGPLAEPGLRRPECELLRHAGRARARVREFSAGARDGANALYNAHQAAAGYSAGYSHPPDRPDTTRWASRAFPSTAATGAPTRTTPTRSRVHAPGVIPDDPWDTPGVIARFSHDIDLPRPRAPARGRSPRRRAAPVTYRVMRGLDLARFLTDDVQLALDRAPRAA